MEMIYCACGCGNQRPKYRSNKPYDSRVCRFIKGHTNKGKHLSEEHKARIGAGNAGRKMSKKQQKLLSTIRKRLIAEGKLVSPWKGKVNKALVEGRKRWVEEYTPKKAVERKNEGRLGHVQGYVTAWDDRKQEYSLEHRSVMEKHIGRDLKTEEHVHHIDGDKTNNAIENLMLFPTQSAHSKFHQKYGFAKSGWKKRD